jgi:hypothetical protein
MSSWSFTKNHNTVKKYKIMLTRFILKFYFVETFTANILYMPVWKNQNVER